MEAIEQGCTCATIGHESGTGEREPAGMVIAADANCPLHGRTLAPRQAD